MPDKGKFGLDPVQPEPDQVRLRLRLRLPAGVA